MEGTVSYNVSDAVSSKGNETKKERPKSLDLESCNFVNEEDQTPDETRQTTR